jgi:hypothetical protein
MEKSLCLGALCKNSLPHLPKWHEKGYQHIYAHQWDRHSPTIEGVHRVRTVPTRWEQTMHAHFILLQAFVQSEFSHMAIVSESCIPIQTKETVEKELKIGASYAYNPWVRNFILRHHGRVRSITDRQLRNECVFHEQWYVICKYHAQLMVRDQSRLMMHMGRMFADNEHMMGTCLAVNNEGCNLLWREVTYAKWEHGASHPASYETAADLPPDAQRFWFARKVLG